MTTIADFFKLVKASRLCCRSSPVDHGTIKPRVAQQAPASNTADRRCFTWRRWPKRGGRNSDRHRLLMGWNEARTQDFGPAIIDFHQLSAKHSWKYVSEFSYRRNMRKSHWAMFNLLIQAFALPRIQDA